MRRDRAISCDPCGLGHPRSTDQVDTAGQAIVTLLHKTADAGEAKTRQTVEVAQGLSNRLNAARERITELESDLQSFRDKVDRTEQWLGKISMEIDDRLISHERRCDGN
jgi:chromosome segregation ATPase